MEGKLDLLHDEIAETLPPPTLRDFVQVEANNAENIVADSLAKLRQLIAQTIDDTGLAIEVHTRGGADEDNVEDIDELGIEQLLLEDRRHSVVAERRPNNPATMTAIEAAKRAHDQNRQFQIDRGGWQAVPPPPPAVPPPPPPPPIEMPQQQGSGIASNQDAAAATQLQLLPPQAQQQGASNFDRDVMYASELQQTQALCARMRH